MIVAENCIAQMVLIFAAARIDAWAVNVNARLSDRELDAISAHSQPRRIVYTVQVSSEAQAHAQRHAAKSMAASCMQGVAIGGLNEDCQPEPVHADAKEQVAALIYTRSDERRVGHESVSTCSSRWSRYHL